MSKRKVAIIGSGNIGTDLMIKILRHGQHLEMAVMVGIDPESEGLARARDMGLKTTAAGVDGLLPHVLEDNIQIAFDATSAYVHAENTRKLNALGVLMIDLTPAAIGPYSQAVRAGNTVYFSGQIPLDPATGDIVAGDPVGGEEGGDGIAGITEATSMVTSYFYPLVQLIYAIGAVTGLIGGIRVYQKFSSGDPDTSKTAASWFGACIFLILVGTVLESFFF